mmetsp:Transcript_52318/g.117531  ORF Transcript_52318/g.117531 Transcript_52318/m.117531 type:complete len:218 (-) Transcript_52318:53-706(-)
MALCIPRTVLGRPFLERVLGSGYARPIPHHAGRAAAGGVNLVHPRLRQTGRVLLQRQQLHPPQRRPHRRLRGNGTEGQRDSLRRRVRRSRSKLHRALACRAGVPGGRAPGAGGRCPNGRCLCPLCNLGVGMPDTSEQDELHLAQFDAAGRGGQRSDAVPDPGGKPRDAAVAAAPQQLRSCRVSCSRAVRVSRPPSQITCNSCTCRGPSCSVPYRVHV